MNLQQNKIFISGGASGIGLELAKALYALGNQIIINGRNQEKLNNAVALLPGTVAIAGDMSVYEERLRIANVIKAEHPTTNWLINNAGVAYAYTLDNSTNSFERAQEEMNLNYLSIVHFTELLLPQLLQQQNSAVVNVTSIAALRGNIHIPTYAASKAALRNYTTSLRDTLEAYDNIGIFELLPPLVNTEFSAEIGGAEHGIPPKEVADELVAALLNNQYEIPVGMTKKYFGN